MPAPSALDKPLLSHAFRLSGSWHPFGRLALFPDRIERRVLGRVREVIPLSAVRDVQWQTTDNTASNFTLHLHDKRVLTGHLRGAGLWKAKLQEMLAGPRRAGRPTSKSSVKPAA